MKGLPIPDIKLFAFTTAHFASWLVQNGVSLYVVQKMLGHRRISQTERYSHLRQDTIDDAVEVFEESWQKNTETRNVINLTK